MMNKKKNDILVHITNRGVDKRKVFLDKQDHLRFIHDLFEFNDKDIVNTTSYIFNKSNDIGGRNIERKQRKLLVDVYAFCLMPNHYHLLVSPRIRYGVSKFMQKVNMGYTKYFNIKYERSGALFEGKYKSVIVRKESHFFFLPYYIHFNPLDLKFSEWREHKIKNRKDALKFLESYRWSSHLDYLGKKNFPSVTKREFLLEYFEGTKGYGSKVYSFLNNFDVTGIKQSILE